MINRISQISSDGFSDNRVFRFKPTDACSVTMTFDSQKCAQTQTDVIKARLAATHLPPLNQTKLLDAAMILFDLPTIRSIFDAFKITDLDFITRPMFRCAVCGCQAKHFNESKIFEPNNFSLLRNLNERDRPQTCSVRINQAIRFQSGQKMPTQRARQFQIFNRPIPTVETNYFGIKA